MKTAFKLKTTVLAIAASLTLVGCNSELSANNEAGSANVALGAPGEKPFWGFSGKNGIGTSYEAYVDGRYGTNSVTGEVSKVWFSLAQGVITESMFGLIHEAQLRELQFVVKGEGYVATELNDTEFEIDYLYKDDSGRPLSLAYKLTNRDKQGRFVIEKHIFTDPDRQSLFVRTHVEPLKGPIEVFAVANPYMKNTGVNDSAWVGEQGVYAKEGDKNLVMLTSALVQSSGVAFKGEYQLSNMLTKGAPTYYKTTGEQTGNVELFSSLGVFSEKQTVDLVVAVATTSEEALAHASSSLNNGYTKVLDKYNQQWQGYIESLSSLPALAKQSTDNGKLAYASALVLKAQEDKTHAGALIASLSNPWGDTVPALESSTGYKAVWVRDFYQVAMAFLAMGDSATAKTAFEYLEKVQVSDKTPGNKGDTGWFLQKTHVDGELEWVAVQLDQTAMPIMLAWQLFEKQVLTKEELLYWYNKMLKPAAEFLVTGGEVNVLWNNKKVVPPMTQQERWEEQAGYSPSSTAATIAGLVTAAKIAQLADDNAGYERFMTTAKQYNNQIEALMFTTSGLLKSTAADGKHYLRINQTDDPNTHSELVPNNGRPAMDKRLILDGGFLELVRYGVREANNEHILASLPEYDDQTIEENLRVRYDFATASGATVPGWRRYGNDGYGEDTQTGNNYNATGENSANQRGRVWPFFTGERGHYELAKLAQNNQLGEANLVQLRNTYVAGMEYFANEGLMLPEQVWDGVGNDKYQYKMGQGTNSATPLAWTHAEYIKLLRSVSDNAVWDYYPVVKESLN